MVRYEDQHGIMFARKLPHLQLSNYDALCYNAIAWFALHALLEVDTRIPSGQFTSVEITNIIILMEPLND